MFPDARAARSTLWLALLMLFALAAAATRSRADVGPDANVTVGSTPAPEMDGLMRVSVVATGIDVMQAEKAAPQGFTPRVVATADRSVTAAAELTASRPMSGGTIPSGGNFATARKLEPEMEMETDLDAEEAVGAVETQPVVDDVADHEIFQTPAEEKAEAKVVAERSYEIPSYPSRSAPEPRHIPASESGLDDGFLAPSAQTARTIDTAPPAPVTQAPAEEKPTGARRFLNRLRGKSRPTDEVESSAQPKRPLFPNRGSEQASEAERAEPMLSGLSLPEAKPRKPAGSEDDLDIPAFLRRQAN